MTRIMHDSTSPGDIPRDAEMVAYYVDGRYAWPQSWINMFPNAVKVSISAIGVRTAEVGDVELGCIWPPADAVPWVLRSRSDGFDPTIYVNELNDWPAVRQAFKSAGVPEPHYWVARYNGVQEVPAGAVARQFAHPHDGDGIADKPWETGKHYDLSIVADFWPGVDNREDDELNNEEKRSLEQTEAYAKETWLAVGADQDRDGRTTIHEHVDFLGNLIIEKFDALKAEIDAIKTGGVSKEEIGKIAKDAVSDDLKNDEE